MTEKDGHFTSDPGERPIPPEADPADLVFEDALYGAANDITRQAQIYYERAKHYEAKGDKEGNRDHYISALFDLMNARSRLLSMARTEFTDEIELLIYNAYVRIDQKAGTSGEGSWPNK